MFRASITAIAALGALGACDRIAPAPVADPMEQSLAASCVGDAAAADRLAQAVEAARVAEGKTVLARTEALDRIAQSHACDMALMGRADVAGSNGSNVVDRARAVGYPTCGVVQLVGGGTSPEGTVADWLIPGPNREQVLGQLSFEIGSGVARGADGRIWHSVVLGNDCRA
ncbi:CAP domain-containing protein [Paracoccus sp. PARArs4]|uniref:CAP domain-containing protein n=1 Tax=Paracoccus sp. PARArs4 TaxID=2853442 RepID=UPI0024A75B75|nr:CAP domain-containing protein [Paracoccus sp. PARArs4]